jgi:hypothetical protein
MPIALGRQTLQKGLILALEESRDVASWRRSADLECQEAEREALVPKDDQEPKPRPVDGPGRADPGADTVPASPTTLRGFEMARAVQGLGGPDPNTAAQDGLQARDSDPFFVQPQPGRGTQTDLTAETPAEAGGAARERSVALGARGFHARGAIALCLTFLVVLMTALVFELIPSLRSRAQRPAALISPAVLPAAPSGRVASVSETQNPFASPARVTANTGEAMTSEASEAIVARDPALARLDSRRPHSSCNATVPRHATSVKKGDAWSTTTPCTASANDIDMDDFSQHFSTKRLEPPP